MDKKNVVIYSGRFSPFHENHYKAYEWLKENFDYPNTDIWIATSNKINDSDSPFNYYEKKEIMTRLFGISEGNIALVKNPYFPREILEQYDSSKTTYIAAVGEKDSERLSESNYFSRLDNLNETQNYEDKGYYTIVPLQEKKQGNHIVNGKLIRRIFSSDDITQDQKRKYFESLYPTFDKKIFEMFMMKFNYLDEEIVEQFLKERGSNIRKLIKEVSDSVFGAPADDGPDTWYTDASDYRRLSPIKSEVAGFTIVGYLFDDSLVNNYKNTTQYHGNTPNVSEFPQHYRGDSISFEDQLASNIDKWFGKGFRKELLGNNIDREEYEEYIKRISQTAGHEFMDWLGDRGYEKGVYYYITNPKIRR